MALAMLWKGEAQTCTTKVVAEHEIASHKISKTIYGCTVEPHESTRQRVESSLLTKHEDRIAGKGFTSMTHYNLVDTFSYASSNEDSGCKSCIGQGMEKARDNPSMATGESPEQEGGYSRSTKRQKESSLCYTDGHVSPQKR